MNIPVFPPYAGTFFFALLLPCAAALSAQPAEGAFLPQERDSVRSELSVKPFPGDSTFGAVRVLDEVVVVGRYTPMSYEDRWRLKRRVKKVWPYAVLASQYLHQMDSLREELSRRKFKAAVNRRQKELFDNFSGILKKFTRSEGRILIKLVYRQTGVSTYRIAQELKGGFKAFWWNASAGLFSLSLKDEYDPGGNEEDFHIENILRECFQAGELAPYPGYTEFSSPFYYRKMEQDIARDRRQGRQQEKWDKKRDRQLRRLSREGERE